MDGTAIAALATAIGGSVTAIGSAWINRGAGEGLKATRAEVEKLTAPDGELVKLKNRLTAIEATIATAATLAGIPAELDDLRGHIESQLKLAREEWDTWKRGQRQRTGSMPALIDEEARHLAADVLRRVEAVETEQREGRQASVDVQLQLARVETKLDLILGNSSIQIGGKPR